MLKLCLRSSTLGLLAPLALIGVSACSSHSLVAGDGGNQSAGPDGSVTDVGRADPAACGCQVAGNTLTISMACYCAEHDCTQSPFALYCSDVSLGIGCGVVEVSAQPAGGLEQWAYNDERTLIGVQLASDTADFTCPTAPSLHGHVLRAGEFPLEDGGLPFESCASVTICPCVDGKMSCPAVDAGTSSAPDAATP